MTKDKFTILIVEDDFFCRKRINKVLLKEGYKTLLAGSAAKAVSLLEAQSCSFIILNVNAALEVINGSSFGQYIRKKLQIPFIYIATAETVETVKFAINDQVSGYLTQPFTDTDLLADIIVKPFKKKKLRASIQALTLATENRQQEQGCCISVADGNFETVLPVEEIDYIQAKGESLRIYSRGILYSQESNLNEISKVLPKEHFLRTHEAFIINKEKVGLVKTDSLIVNNIEIPVSEKYLDNVRNAVIDSQ